MKKRHAKKNASGDTPRAYARWRRKVWRELAGKCQRDGDYFLVAGCRRAAASWAWARVKYGR